MESIGDKIRKVREEKGYSLDQVARDTHITRRFLEALEVENFSAMPGESYVIGFLRSYTEYLGMNPDEIVQLYKNLKLQEQPAPMSELLEKPRMAFSTIVGIVVLGVVVLVGAIILIVSGSQGSNQAADSQTLAAKQVADGKTFQNDVIERSYAPGETIRVPGSNGSEIDLIVGLNADKQAQLTIGGNAIVLPLEKESVLDVDQDGKLDIRVTVRKIDTKASPASIVLRLDRVVQSPQGATPAVVATTPAGPGTISVGNTNQPARVKQPLLLPEYTDLQNIAVTVRFEGSCVFRYETNTGKREERMMDAGEALDISANSWIRLWIANAGRATIKVGGRDIKAGNDGEVVAYTLDYAAAGTGRQLELAPLY